MRDFSSVRIVEISDSPYLKRTFPNQVVYFSTSPDRTDHGRADNGASIVSLATFGALWRVLREAETSIVVCRPTFYSPWDVRWISRVLFSRRVMHRVPLLPRAFGPQLLRWRVSAPVVIWDDADMPLINRNNFFLLDRCHLYFKRELPPDRWRLFMKTGHENLPTARFRNSARYLARIGKLRPVSIGVPPSAPEPFPVPSFEKSTDIFFAGTIETTSSIRKQGLSELNALRERGFIIDIAERRLPQSEFYRRCAQALLTWSPEGHGWDCFRHYEAALCGSVPLINQPTIERYQPLGRGEHAIYYDVEEGQLTQAAVSALADRPRLAVMGRAARAHVLAHHTRAAISWYIARACLETASGSAGLFLKTPLEQDSDGGSEHAGLSSVTPIVSGYQLRGQPNLK